MDTRFLLGGVIVLLAGAGCLGPDLTFGGAGGGGGDPASTSTGGGAPATTGTTVGAGGEGGAGSPECVGPEDCPAPGDPCLAPACADGACGEVPAPIDAPCELDPQAPGVCDGAGTCVQCTRDDQCSGTDTCDEVAGVCLPRCQNGEQDGDETDVDCGGSCEADCVAGQGCIERGDCEGNVCDDAGLCATGKAVFVTADWLRPDFGGALAGDAICQQTAEAAGLGGTFMAWLSDSTTSPSVRFTPSAAPYRRLDGVLVAGDWAQLTSGVLLAPLEIDENGGVNPFAEVWTATFTDGTAFPPTCLDWTTQDIAQTGSAGRTSDTDFEWTNVYSQFCDRTGLRLYCFQQ